MLQELGPGPVHQTHTMAKDSQGIYCTGEATEVARQRSAELGGVAWALWCSWPWLYYFGHRVGMLIDRTMGDIA